MEKVKTALNDEASVAASRKIAYLQDIADMIFDKHSIALTDSATRRSAVEICRALGNDEFTQVTSSKEEREYRINVAVIEVCRSCLEGSGLTLDALARLVSNQLQLRVTQSDIVDSVEAMGVFGSGIKLERLKNGELRVLADMTEISTEQGDVLVACDALGYVTVEMLVYELKWASNRAKQVLTDMVRGGMLWVDEQVRPTNYWVLNN